MGAREQIIALSVAFVLSALIGLERQLRSKSAGLRTHTLVGVGSALFMIVSKYGFSDILQVDLVRLDPSRVASQVVSGIGFIGAGLIFLRRDVVRGLTSAAIVWLTAAVGMAAGAGLWPVATVTVAAHYLVTFAFPPLQRLLPKGNLAQFHVEVRYRDGEGALRTILERLTGRRFLVEDLDIGRVSEDGRVEVSMEVHGRGPVEDLLVDLHGQFGIESIRVGAADDAPAS